MRIISLQDCTYVTVGAFDILTKYANQDFHSVRVLQDFDELRTGGEVFDSLDSGHQQLPR